MSNRQQIKVIQSFLREQKNTARLNNTWQYIIHNWGIGRVTGDQITITHLERESLRVRCQREYGVDPLATDLSGDRLDLASQSADEKVSRLRVFADMCQVYKPGSEPLQLRSGPALTPSGTLLSVCLDQINLDNISHFIVVENGAAIKSSHLIQVPRSYRSPLFVYRGHGENTKDVAEFLRNTSISCPKVGFYDLDPAGIILANDIGVYDELLIPDLDLTQDRDTYKEHMKSREFYDQMAQVKNRAPLAPGTLKELLDIVVSKKWSFTQEAMISLKLSLKLVELH